MAVVGMTIKQLPDFAFRSAGDYAAAMERHPRALRPGAWAPAIVDVLERLSVFDDLPLGVVQRRRSSVLVISIVVCTLDRTPRLWRGVARHPGRPARAVLRPAAARPGGDGPRWPAADASGPCCAGTGSGSARRPTADGTRFLYGDRHHYTKMATLLTHTGLVLFLVAAAVTSRLGRRAGPGRRRGRVAHGPADRDARAAARQEPRLRGARASTPARRRTSPRTSRSTRTASRSRARPSGSTTRCRSAATRSTRTASGRRRTSSSRTRPGQPLWDGAVPLTDAADGSPYGILPVPGRDIGLQLLLRKADDGSTVVLMLPYRVDRREPGRVADHRELRRDRPEPGRHARLGRPRPVRPAPGRRRRTRC